MSAIIVRNEIVHYEVLGRGRPVLFLHGWVGSWRTWLPTLQAVSQTFRGYAVDFWGYGDTAKAPNRYTLKAQSELIAEFMDSLGIRKVAIVAHGLGALVGTRFTLTHPGLVDRLFLAGMPVAADHIHSPLRNQPLKQIAPDLLQGLQDEAYLLKEAEKTDEIAIAQALASLNNMHPEQILLELHHPCLLVYSRDDRLVHPPEAALADRLPMASHIFFLDNAGDLPMLSRANQFSRLVLDFLNLPADQSPRTLILKDEWKRRFR